MVLVGGGEKLNHASVAMGLLVGVWRCPSVRSAPAPAPLCRHLHVAPHFCPLVLEGAKRLPSVDHYGTDMLQSNADLVHKALNRDSSFVPDSVKYRLLKHSAHLMESGDNVGHAIMHLYRLSIDYCVDEHLVRHSW